MFPLWMSRLVLLQPFTLICRPSSQSCAVLQVLWGCYQVLCQGYLSPLLASLIACLSARRMLGGFQEIKGPGREPTNPDGVSQKPDLCHINLCFIAITEKLKDMPYPTSMFSEKSKILCRNVLRHIMLEPPIQ